MDGVFDALEDLQVPTNRSIQGASPGGAGHRRPPAICGLVAPSGEVGFPHRAHAPATRSRCATTRASSALIAWRGPDNPLPRPRPDDVAGRCGPSDCSTTHHRSSSVYTRADRGGHTPGSSTPPLTLCAAANDSAETSSPPLDPRGRRRRFVVRRLQTARLFREGVELSSPIASRAGREVGMAAVEHPHFLQNPGAHQPCPTAVLRAIDRRPSTTRGRRGRKLTREVRAGFCRTLFAPAAGDLLSPSGTGAGSRALQPALSGDGPGGGGFFG